MPIMRRWLSLHPRRTLVEPFAGGASVSLAAVAEGVAADAVLCDADDCIAAFWQVVLGADAHRLINEVLSLPICEQAARDRLAAAPKSSVDAAFQTLLRNRLARGGLITDGSGLSRRGEGDRGLLSRWYPQTLADRIARIYAMRDRLRFVHGDGIELLQQWGDHPDALAFIDPPYALDHRGPGSRLYRHHSLDQRALLSVAAAMAGGFTLTNQDSPDVRSLVFEHGLDARPLPMVTAHHRTVRELLIGRDLRWLPLAAASSATPRHRVAGRRRDDAVVPSGLHDRMTCTMSPTNSLDHLLSATEAAARLGISRRTLDRLMARGEVERVAGADGRTYVTQESVEALRRVRGAETRRRLRVPDAASLLDAVDRLVEALREEREATVRALTDREAARIELAAARAELHLLRQLAGLSASGTPSSREPAPRAPAEPAAR